MQLATGEGRRSSRRKKRKKSTGGGYGGGYDGGDGGGGGGGVALSRQDAEYIRKNTRFDTEEIQEWYR